VTKRQRTFVNEWTQWFRDAQITDCQPARLVGYALATFANADGTSIRPGAPRLMVAAGIKNRATLTKGLRWLQYFGWIAPVADATPTRAAEYRLTRPPDLDQQLKWGAREVARLKSDKRWRDAQWTDTRRDQRLGLRP
jgi:hypothetical protein